MTKKAQRERKKQVTSVIFRYPLNTRGCLPMELQWGQSDDLLALVDKIEEKSSSWI